MNFQSDSGNHDNYFSQPRTKIVSTDPYSIYNGTPLELTGP